MSRKKIGLIDYYIDEWHANNYPGMIAHSQLGTEFEVAYAWEEIPAPDKRPLETWCREYGITPCGSIEEIVHRSDALFVLSPTFPEHHERLAETALKSGKPVFIDKPFCDTAMGVKRIFELADRYKTPVTGFSALRFAPTLTATLPQWQEHPPRFALARGGGIVRGFLNYGIHPITMLTMCMGSGAQRIMQLWGRESEIDSMILEYSDNRRAELIRTPQSPFELIGFGENEFDIRNIENFFEHSIDAILSFFQTGENPVSRAEILETVRIYEAGIKALQRPGEWVEIPAI